MADGKFSVPFSRFLDYDRGEDGGLVINEKEAQTVRLIFRLYLDGLSYYSIAKELTRRGALTVTGKEKWSAKTINGILENIKIPYLIQSNEKIPQTLENQGFWLKIRRGK